MIVTSPSGTSPTTPADVFTYVAAPAVTKLSPSFGPAAGGTLVTITGTGFTGVTEVDFGTTPATSLTFLSDTSITAESPAGTGVVDVTVTAAGGTSPISSADQFSYAPTVTGLSPDTARRRRHIGDVTGSGFTGATAVDFGTTPATSLRVIDTNR